MSTPAVPRPRGRWRVVWVTLALLMLLALVAGELFCRFYLGLGDPPLSIADPKIEYRFKPSSSYRRFGNRIHFNAYSMRSDDFPVTRTDPNELRVMVLGDSVVNGGALTDQADLATSILQSELRKRFKRPVIVGNISAGSWGPGNLRAYVERFGWFDADVAVVVLSSHDYIDNPTFDPALVGDGQLRTRAPLSALTEAVGQFGMPYAKHLFGTGRAVPAPPLAPPLPVDEQAVARALADLLELVQSARAADVRILLALNPEVSEILAPPMAGYMRFKEFARQHDVEVVDLAPTYVAGARAGRTVYRDSIHLTPAGQQLMVEALMPSLERHLEGAAALRQMR